MSQPAVLHVLGQLNRGGAELRTLEAIEYLVAQGKPMRHDVVLLSGLPGELDERWADHGGQLHYIPVVQHPSKLLDLTRLLRRLRPTVVHSHVALFSGTVLALAKSIGIQHRVAQFHSSSYTPSSFWYTQSQKALLDWAATDYLGVSSVALRGFLGDHWAKDPRARVAYNGLNHDLFASTDASRAKIRAETGTSSDKRVLITVARLDDMKRHELLVDAIAPVLDANPLVEWWIVGRDDTAHAQKNVLPRLNEWPASRRSRVKLLGLRDDVSDLLSGADAFLFASEREGLPGATLEALASGLPVLAADIIPHQEILSQLPGLLSLLPVEAGAPTWTSAIMSFVENILAGNDSGRAQARSIVMNQLAQSPFTMKPAAERLSRVWQYPAG